MKSGGNFMKYSELKKYIAATAEDKAIVFLLPNQENIVPHFHITDIGTVKGHFVDCGGISRIEHNIQIQLWLGNDTDHRIKVKNILSILNASEQQLNPSSVFLDSAVLIEYGESNASRFNICQIETTANAVLIHLSDAKTQCLAKARSACGGNKKAPVSCC